MTGSPQGKTVSEMSLPPRVEHLHRTRGEAMEATLLQLRPWRVPERDHERVDAKRVPTLLTVTAGLLLGSLLTGLTLFALNVVSLNQFLQFLVPALIGAGVGGLLAWVIAKRRVQRAALTSEGYRRRLMSVERNQALWISLSAVLHDVRSPLQSLTLYIESLGVPGTDPIKVRDLAVQQLDQINLRIRRVTRRVAELSGGIDRRPVSIERVLNEVREMAQDIAKQSATTIEVRHPGDIPVVADPRFLVQAIDHLVLNSVHILSQQNKDRPRRILLCTGEGDERSVVLLIKDTGPGLPDAVKDRLFEPLTSAQSAGMGLGLAIAHALASAAGAELELRRTDQTGTEFGMRLERARA